MCSETYKNLFHCSSLKCRFFFVEIRSYCLEDRSVWLVTAKLLTKELIKSKSSCWKSCCLWNQPPSNHPANTQCFKKTLFHRYHESTFSKPSSFSTPLALSPHPICFPIISITHKLTFCFPRSDTQVGLHTSNFLAEITNWIAAKCLPIDLDKIELLFCSQKSCS